MKTMFVCRDRNNKRVYTGDKFLVKNSSMFDPIHDVCKFFWDADLLQICIKTQHMNPKAASFGSYSETNNAHCYTEESIEKI